MITAKFVRFLGATILVLVTLVGATSTAFAESPPDGVLEVEAGLACPFRLVIEIRGGNQMYKEFTDKNDKVVRFLQAGTGSALTFINPANGMTLALKANGSVTHITNRADGSQLWTVTGHEVLILFPTDIPAGPTTTLYVGRVVFTVDPDGVYTLQSTSGQSTDICAALSQGG